MSFAEPLPNKARRRSAWQSQFLSFRIPQRGDVFIHPR